LLLWHRTGRLGELSCIDQPLSAIERIRIYGEAPFSHQSIHCHPAYPEALGRLHEGDKFALWHRFLLTPISELLSVHKILLSSEYVKKCIDKSV